MEEPRIVSKGAFTLIGLEYRGKNENQEIPNYGASSCQDSVSLRS